VRLRGAPPLGSVLTRYLLQWILHYNLKWLTGDLIAGITVGMVLVPQAMVRPSHPLGTPPSRL